MATTLAQIPPPAAAISARLAPARRLAYSAWRLPANNGWEWHSIRPGSTDRPAASIVRTDGSPHSRSTSAVSPTAATTAIADGHRAVGDQVQLALGLAAAGLAMV